ncbi:hypothetical protein C8T65DRAFT_562868, partial [Cerioporus squamosus]
VCAICLGRHPPSEVARCNAHRTWDGRSARCRRVNGRIQTEDGRVLCTDWQRDRGCSSSSHGERHECSGCGHKDHGAHACPRAQK